MEKFCIILNEYKKEAFKTSEIILKYIEDKNLKGTLFRFNENTIEELLNISDDYDCVIVLGGDGTFIQTARRLIEKNIPLIGVNFGKLGFLADIDKDYVIKMMDKLVKDEYLIEKRMLLQGDIYKKDRETINSLALNDIVINRTSNMRIQIYKIYVNGQYLNTYHADGIIISTPTGSTAYNLSAGGPIAIPSANLILMTPICPHTLNTRTIVFSANDIIEIEIIKDREDNNNDKVVAFDGNTIFDIRSGEKIIITKAIKDIKIIKLNQKSFLETLRRKMGDHEERQT